nr:peptidoglycan-binding protein [Cellulomonas septica]
MRVDDRPLRALTSSAPPWRSIGVGDAGADVTRVQEFLAATGYYRGAVDGTYGRGMRAAVERFNVDAGLGKGVSTFEPSTIVWVGPDALTVAESLAPVGAQVAPGAPVLRAPARHAAVVVTEPQGGISPTGQFGDSAELVVGTVVVPYTPGSGTVTTQTDVDLVRGALAPALEGVAQVRAVDAQQVAVVPASALVQGADGSLCAYSSADAEPVVVQPVGGGVGTVHLPAETALAEVVANPGRITLEVACGL